MKSYLFGADIGGTTVKLGIFKTDGELVSKWEITTVTDNGGEQIIPDIAASCKEKAAEAGIALEEFAGIGMGVPGPVHKDGSVDVCVNLGWGKKQVKKEMEEALGIPAEVGNDANVAALGEMWQGGGKGHSDVVMVTLGTGVGGGVIVNGEVISGFHGYGGEIGHITMNPNETVACNCGKCGCLEQYCSATGIVNEAKKALRSSTEITSLRAINPITAKDVFDAAKNGDAFAQAQFEQFAQRLALGLSFISCVTDPEIFVIGGGVSKAGTMITDAVEKYFKNNVFGNQKETTFALATLGNDAGIYGSAKLVLK